MSTEEVHYNVRVKAPRSGWTINRVEAQGPYGERWLCTIESVNPVFAEPKVDPICVLQGQIDNLTEHLNGHDQSIGRLGMRIEHTLEAVKHSAASIRADRQAIVDALTRPDLMTAERSQPSERAHNYAAQGGLDWRNKK